LRKGQILKRVIIALVVASLSGGWLFAFWLGISNYATGLRNLIVGEQASHSVPYFEFADKALQMGAVWGSLSIGVWAFVGAYRLLSSRGRASSDRQV
jgi:hypothetical protein